MAKELEIEIQVKSLAPTRQKLQKLGKLIKKLKSTDYLFNSDFLKQDIVLRLRDIETQFPKVAKEVVMTFKTPRKVKSVFQSRQELEFRADDFKSVFDFLQALYGKPTLQFTWLGEKYGYRGCTIFLKDTIGIIKFVEIEGPSQKQIAEVQEELKIEGEPLKMGALEIAKRKLGLSE